MRTVVNEILNEILPLSSSHDIIQLIYRNCLHWSLVNSNIVIEHGLNG